MNVIKKLIPIIIIFVINTVFAQTITLTPQNNHIVVKKAGSVTFKYWNDIHVSCAREEGLKNISGLTFSAGIIYDTGFTNGYLTGRGKIFNYTSHPITIDCLFYNNNYLIAKYTIDVNPRTFSRMIPDEWSIPNNCNKVICIEKGINIGNTNTVQTNKPRNNYTEASSHHFHTKTVFYAESSDAKQTVTYNPDGTCSCIGYVLNDGYWIKGTSSGKYTLKSNTIDVVWDEWIHESYQLSNNSYSSDGLYFIRQ